MPLKFEHCMHLDPRDCTMFTHLPFEQPCGQLQKKPYSPVILARSVSSDDAPCCSICCRQVLLCMRRTWLASATGFWSKGIFNSSHLTEYAVSSDCSSDNAAAGSGWCLASCTSSLKASCRSVMLLPCDSAGWMIWATGEAIWVLSLSILLVTLDSHFAASVWASSVATAAATDPKDSMCQAQDKIVSLIALAITCCDPDRVGLLTFFWCFFLLSVKQASHVSLPAVKNSACWERLQDEQWISSLVGVNCCGMSLPPNCGIPEISKNFTRSVRLSCIDKYAGTTGVLPANVSAMVIQSSSDRSRNL